LLVSLISFAGVTYRFAGTLIPLLVSPPAKEKNRKLRMKKLKGLGKLVGEDTN
jgi:hypothetical protein